MKCCKFCSAPLCPDKRQDAKFCNDSCRLKAYRAGKGPVKATLPELGRFFLLCVGLKAFCEESKQPEKAGEK